MGDKVAARARRLVGVRFRPQGRSVETGLDCIGLAALAVRAKDVRRDYALRGGTAEELFAGFRAANMRPVKASIPGDVLVLRPGVAQLHLAIVTNGGFVHADAGARRVVETPGRPDWPVIAVWRKRARG
ncbi:peptidoglycan endopeptidase [Allosphingosinicella flava]|uniref:Peptidoglycan endopeptidase n=2 Tax=Allosphingosinicella flava TaxID=2771430 RepID=A0A7T2GM01_9SPHN|nr:peptidoglycan endopeptidase [Sphingosinicella flava]